MALAGAGNARPRGISCGYGVSGHQNRTRYGKGRSWASLRGVRQDLPRGLRRLARAAGKGSWQGQLARADCPFAVAREHAEWTAEMGGPAGPRNSLTPARAQARDAMSPTSMRPGCRTWAYAPAHGWGP